MGLPALTLKRKRERSVCNRHPWVFSGAIDSLDDEAEDGALIDVLSASGQWLARGYLNRRSQISVRLLTWDREQAVDADFWRERLARSIAGRAQLEADPGVTGFRLVNAESDGLPGLIVDRYGDWVVLQVLTLGMERHKTALVNSLVEAVDGLRGVYERSDADVRKKEGLLPSTGCLWGKEPNELIEIRECGYRFLVDVKRGHKTGFYLDQRDNRRRLSAYCSGADVLNAFAYTGAFGVYALGGGAGRLVNLDTSDDALSLAQHHVTLNGYMKADVSCQTRDVFAELRAYRAQGRHFDVVILDPPRFAPSRSHIRKASRGYKDINLLAFQIIRTGGVLFTFSCSGLVSRDLFQKIVFGAALDAGRDAQIVGYLNQADDHPVALFFPEAAYLKGLICRVL